LKRSKTDVYIQCQQHKLKVSIWKFYQAYCEIVEKIEKERPYSIQLLKILISQDRCHLILNKTFCDTTTTINDTYNHKQP